jgi:hypothetical protein
VNFAITVGPGAGLVVVSPSAGHLRTGQRMTIIVTASAKVTATRTITLSPNGVVTLHIIAKL